MKVDLLIGLYLLICMTAKAQRTLNPISDLADDIESILGKSAKSKMKVTVQSETGVGMELNCEYEGFTEKKYSIKFEVLSKLKTTLKEITPVTLELNTRAKSIDVNLQFKPLASQIYQNNLVESSFLRLTVIEEGLSELEKLLRENRSYLFDCKKAWSVKTIANNNTVVEIRLMPLPAAAALKPSN
ncbi:MAG: hypothetical protein SH818_19055 [Saprospiraceae bacterium]|nr:hypothetical protein [Saprospiraceae bacterium]